MKNVMKGQYEEESCVGMETKICVVCGGEYETNVILMDMRLMNSLTRHTCTGWGICPEHRKKIEEGYVFLVEVSATEPSDNPPHTGLIIMLRRKLARRLFTVPVQKVGYMTPDVTEKIRQTMRANGLELPEEAESVPESGAA